MHLGDIVSPNVVLWQVPVAGTSGYSGRQHGAGERTWALELVGPAFKSCWQVHSLAFRKRQISEQLQISASGVVQVNTLSTKEQVQGRSSVCIIFTGNALQII